MPRPKLPPDRERPDDEPLARLAARLGLALEVRRDDGTVARVPDATLRALTQALGYDAATDDRVQASLARLDTVERPLITPVRLMTRSSIQAQELDVELVEGGAREVRWTLDLRTENGTRSSHHGHRQLRGRPRFSVPYPKAAPLGYHELALTVTTGNQRWFGEQRWIVVPDGCHGVDHVLGDDRGFGVHVHLHTLRSDRGWGLGDLTDLRLLSHALGASGADYIALAPLHALLNHWPEINPYAPTSRLFGNPISIDIEAVPELEECHDTRQWLRSDRIVRKLEGLRTDALIDYDAVGSLKMQTLRRLHRSFLRHHRRRDTARGRAFDAYRAEQGPLLDAYAVFCALNDLMKAAEGQPDWRSWPHDLQRPNSPAVRDFAEMHGELVDFHRYLQFELDRQLGCAAAAARDAGLRIGLVQELAMGSAGGGFDTWAFRELFALDVDLGHPVGPLRPDGGRWSLPPLIPDRLRQEGYGYWSRLLRNLLRHAGGLRIDHILGLLRQRWIPRTLNDDHGTDLHPRSFDLFGIVALESRRAHAVVFGETLGDIPDSLPATLERWRILPSHVLDLTTTPDAGDPATGETRRQPRTTPSSVHARARDQSPLAAWWAGRDVALRFELGLIVGDEARADAEAKRIRDRNVLIAHLVTHALLPPNLAPPSYLEMIGALHAALALSPARLVGIWMDDLLAESEPSYMLDVAPERFPSWCRRASRPLAEVLADPTVMAALRATRRPASNRTDTPSAFS